jgi:tetratricopeptide (TPR) repeat protein
MRLAGIPTRLAVGLLLVIALTIAGASYYFQFGSWIESATLSNVRGYSLLQDGEFEGAIEQFERAADLEPTEANPWDSLGEGYLASGMPDKSLDAYSRALTIESTLESSLLGRELALAALGRYDEAFGRTVPDFRIRAYLLSRVGRYVEAAQVLGEGRTELTDGNDAEAIASALVTSAWLSIERRQYVRALEELRTAEKMLGQDADEAEHPILVFGDLLAGVAEIRRGNVPNAAARLGSQKLRSESDDRVQANWVAALEGEIALAQGQHDRAMSSFRAAESRAWVTLGGDTLAVFATNPPSRDGRARVEIARGNRAAAIEEYRRLTAVGPGSGSAVLEPRYILALARLLDEEGDRAGARVEYGRFVKLWANADEGLPEIEEARRALARLSAS